MHPIYPVTAETCSAYYGRPVCVVMNDGTRYVGILSCVRGGKLILNEQGGDAGVTRMKRGASVKRTGKSRRGKRAGLKAAAAPIAAPYAPGVGVPYGAPVVPPYGPVYPYGPELALDLAAISLLLLLFV